MKSIGDNIKKARKKAGLSQESLAKTIGVTKAAISRYESGLREPSFEQLQKIARSLHVHTFDLIGKTATEAYEKGVDNASAMNEHFENVMESIWKSYGYTGSEEEGQLIHAFSRLNPEGQKKAIERVLELLEVPKYQNSNPPAELEILPLDELEDLPY